MTLTLGSASWASSRKETKLERRVILEGAPVGRCELGGEWPVPLESEGRPPSPFAAGGRVASISPTPAGSSEEERGTEFLPYIERYMVF